MRYLHRDLRHRRTSHQSRSRRHPNFRVDRSHVVRTIDDLRNPLRNLKTEKFDSNSSIDSWPIEVTVHFLNPAWHLQWASPFPAVAPNLPPWLEVSRGQLHPCASSSSYTP
ncbi:hypothetical protein SCLCIDRAFT_996283 [Scleroderma citrinum Foug A]|uniref:Uncharacterized protein n=1 Tax=Scleroderma citrinum Foug A TaxID=1036808 RepID=A0A0C3DUB2_9AGAM|nr:hypothetical protein SCLCIDRAFT_996283 [Scleroderma citrinum Foug A]